jgi:hypothetical protein
MAYSVESFSFDVRCSSSEIERDLARLLDPFVVEGEGRHHFVVRESRGPFRFEVQLDRVVVHRNDRPRGVVDFILWNASTTAIDGIHDRLVVHAGAVSFARRGVLLPAPPDSGKTTLTAGLVRAGFRYLTDEAAVIDPDSARLYPFPRALWVEPGSLSALAGVRPGRGVGTVPQHDGRAVHVAPEEIRERSIGGRCAVSFVIFPRYRASAAVELTPLSRAAAVVELANNTYNLRQFGADGIRLLARLTARSSCYRLSLGDLAGAVSAVRDVVRGTTSAHHA